MPLPHYAYDYTGYRRRKRMGSISRLLSIFLSKKTPEDVDKHSR